MARTGRVNQNELRVQQQLEAVGWEVLTSGWPDFLCERAGRVVAVEVKGQGDHLRDHQRDVHERLIRVGLHTLVMHTRPGWDAPLIEDHLAPPKTELEIMAEERQNVARFHRYLERAA